jgi:hypothetical protein
MRTCKAIMAVVLVCWLGTPLVFAAGGKNILSFYIGEVQMKSGPHGKWVQVTDIGKELKTGDQIKTLEETRVEITLATGGVVRIGEKSLYTVEALADSTGGKSSATLVMGKVWSNVKTLSQTKSEFRIQSPTAVAAIRGTVYSMEAGKDSSSTTVKVYNGEVAVSPSEPTGQEAKKNNQRPGEVSGPQEIAPPSEVSMEQWVEIIKAQQQIVVHRDGSKEKSDFDLNSDAKNKWVKWNIERDKKLEASQPAEKEKQEEQPAEPAVPQKPEEK